MILVCARVHECVNLYKVYVFRDEFVFLLNIWLKPVRFDARWCFPTAHWVSAWASLVLSAASCFTWRHRVVTDRLPLGYREHPTRFNDLSGCALFGSHPYWRALLIYVAVASALIQQNGEGRHYSLYCTTIITG